MEGLSNLSAEKSGGWGGRKLKPEIEIRASDFNLPPVPARPTMGGMFDTITAELGTAADKLAHLRRFL